MPGRTHHAAVEMIRLMALDHPPKPDATTSLTQGVSGLGSCYDNAVAESFFRSLKVELTAGCRFEDRETLRQQVLEYIEIDCSRTRRHSSLGYVGPETFEAALAG